MKTIKLLFCILVFALLSGCFKDKPKTVRIEIRPHQIWDDLTPEQKKFYGTLPAKFKKEISGNPSGPEQMEEFKTFWRRHLNRITKKAKRDKLANK